MQVLTSTDNHHDYYYYYLKCPIIYISITSNNYTIITLLLQSFLFFLFVHMILRKLNKCYNLQIVPAVRRCHIDDYKYILYCAGLHNN